jgi:hypothetical protein
MSKILILLKKDFLLELRQQHTFFGILLYVASTIFVLYLAMGQPESTVFLDDSIIRLCKCRGQKFYAGKQRPDALFLYHYKPCSIYYRQINLQYPYYASYGFVEPCIIQGFAWQPGIKPVAICRYCLSWRFKFKPCIYFDVGHRSKGTTKCGHNGNTRFSFDHSAVTIIDSPLKSCFWRDFQARSAIPDIHVACGP